MYDRRCVEALLAAPKVSWFEGDAIKPKSPPRKDPYRLLRRGLMSLLTLFVCLGCGWLGLKAAYPFVTAARQRAANDDLERQLRRYRIRNQHDEREIKMLETPEGIVRAARRLGFVQPGERRLRIPND